MMVGQPAGTRSETSMQGRLYFFVFNGLVDTDVSRWRAGTTAIIYARFKPSGGLVIWPFCSTGTKMGGLQPSKHPRKK
jgi:hypothetical protein